MSHAVRIATEVDFWAMGIPQPNGCIHWGGRTDSAGYGRMGPGLTGSTHAHRSAWLLAHGAIPDSLTVEHTCHSDSGCTAGDRCLHRRCINPDHLSLLPKGENSSKQHSAFRFRPKCPKGHDKRALPSGQRYCPTCTAEATRAWLDKNGNRARENAARNARRATVS